MFIGKSALRRHAQRLNQPAKFEDAPLYDAQAGVPKDSSNPAAPKSTATPDTVAKSFVGSTVAVPGSKPFTLK